LGVVRVTLSIAATAVLGALATGGAAAATVAPAAPPITVLKPVTSTTPSPRTAQKAVALARANTDTNKAASPFKSEIRWIAQWRGDRWWLLGIFSSEWGTRFVVDATVKGGTVSTYINYSSRPSVTWVRTTARRWQLRTLYTRLTPAAAIQLAEKTVDSGQYTILGAAAKLARDSAQDVGWYFAIYAQNAAGAKVVLTVVGLGGRPVQEGNYVDGYGFGAQPELQMSVPLNLTDWVRSVAKSRNWTPSNLP
jgi:hypothetical protein